MVRCRLWPPQVVYGKGGDSGKHGYIFIYIGASSLVWADGNLKLKGWKLEFGNIWFGGDPVKKKFDRNSCRNVG